MLARIVLSRIAARPPSLARLRSTAPASFQQRDQPRQVNVLKELEDRGFVAATTSPTLQHHVSSPRTIYSGVDPSASSLHVGNLLPLLGLLHFHVRGHNVLALIGGATGSIGDPSGRSTERSFLTSTELQHNVSCIAKQVERFFERGQAYVARGRLDNNVASRQLDNSSMISTEHETGQGAEVKVGEVKVVNNLDWTKDVSLIDFLRTVGKMARVNVMMARDSVKNRLQSESGISYTEFTYQLLQANDFLHLFTHHGCTIQMGGSDQWGNIVAGTDLIKRSQTAGQVLDEGPQSQSPEEAAAGREAAKGKKEEEVAEAESAGSLAYGLTIPLLTTSTGEKFGKSAGNAVWLDETRTGVADFYQFFFRTTDEDVGRYLRLFTFLPADKIDKALYAHQHKPKARIAQRLLANEVTELVHGGLRKAQHLAQLLYSSTPSALSAAEVVEAFEGDPRLHNVKWSEVKGLPVSKLAVKYGLVKARADASRAIKAGSFYLNDRRVNDPRHELHRQDLVGGTVAMIKVGNKNHLVLNVVTAGEGSGKAGSGEGGEEVGGEARKEADASVKQE